MKPGWSVVMLALVLACIAALWPQTDGADSGPATTPDTVTPAQRAPAFSPPPDAEYTSNCHTPTASGQQGPLAGVTVRCVGGATDLDLADALGNETVLLNLWASWCGPCRTEMPVLDSYAAEDGAIRVVGINVEDRPDAASMVLRELNIRYSNYIDTGAIQNALAAPPVLPLSYIVTSDGAVERITDPTVFDTPEQIRTAVKDSAS